LRIGIHWKPRGGKDIIRWLIATKLTQHHGKQVILENRPGAGCIIRTEVMAKTAGDGYTLGLASVGHRVQPTRGRKMPFEILNYPFSIRH